MSIEYLIDQKLRRYSDPNTPQRELDVMNRWFATHLHYVVDYTLSSMSMISIQEGKETALPELVNLVKPVLDIGYQTPYYMIEFTKDGVTFTSFAIPHMKHYKEVTTKIPYTNPTLPDNFFKVHHWPMSNARHLHNRMGVADMFIGCNLQTARYASFECERSNSGINPLCFLFDGDISNRYYNPDMVRRITDLIMVVQGYAPSCTALYYILDPVMYRMSLTNDRWVRWYIATNEVGTAWLILDIVDEKDQVTDEVRLALSHKGLDGEGGYYHNRVVSDFLRQCQTLLEPYSPKDGGYPF